jgi:hypothetical protein
MLVLMIAAMIFSFVGRLFRLVPSTLVCPLGYMNRRCERNRRVLEKVKLMVQKFCEGFRNAISVR